MFLQHLFSGEEIYLIPDQKVMQTITQEEALPQKPESQLKNSQPPIHNPQSAIIVVNKPDAEDMILLSKILKSVQLDLEMIELLDVAKLKGENIKEVLLQKNTNNVITFGVPLTKLNLQILLTPYQIREAEGVKFLYADGFKELSNDVARKKRLWVCLQAIFTSSSQS